MFYFLVPLKLFYVKKIKNYLYFYLFCQIKLVLMKEKEEEGFHLLHYPPPTRASFLFPSPPLPPSQISVMALS